MTDPGSFRDPDSRVFTAGGRVYRGLSEHGAKIDAEVRQCGLMADLVARGLLVDNDRVEGVDVPEAVPSHAVVESRRVPVVSYPGEWSFAMLRDAALVALDANLIALEHGFILKDASAFNVTFNGSAPVLIDVSSFEHFSGLWNAYAQFCDHFLAPLLLEAYGGVPFQEVIRSSVAGMPIVHLDGLLRGRARWRRGVPTHVRMRARAERRAQAADTNERRRYREINLPVGAVTNTVRSMRSLVARLRSRASSTWSSYEADLPYAGEAIDAKMRFIGEAVRRAHDVSLALDVGCNAGMYSKILGERFGAVVAIDVDPGVVDAVYRAHHPSLTPLVVDVTNPTPAFGWRGVERTSFNDRVRPTFSSWLAVAHHLCLGQGIPLPEIVDLIVTITPEAVVEFVHTDDPMVSRITASRRGRHLAYELSMFEALIAQRARTVSRERISPTRTLFHFAAGAGS